MHELEKFCSSGCFKEMVNFCVLSLLLFVFLSTICNCGVLISTTHNKEIKLCRQSIFLCAGHFSHVLKCEKEKNIDVRRYLCRELFRGTRPNAPIDNAKPDAKDTNSTGLKGRYVPKHTYQAPFTAQGPTLQICTCCWCMYRSYYKTHVNSLPQVRSSRHSPCICALFFYYLPFGCISLFFVNKMSKILHTALFLIQHKFQ